MQFYDVCSVDGTCARNVFWQRDSTIGARRVAMLLLFSACFLATLEVVFAFGRWSASTATLWFIGFIYVAWCCVISGPRPAARGVRYLLAETLDFSLNDISDRFFGQREIGFHARLCLDFFLFIQGVLESFGCFGSHALKVEIIHERIGALNQ